MKLPRRLATRRWRSQLGWPGAVGAAAAVACLALYFSMLQPAERRLEAARLNASSLHERITRAGIALKDRERPVDEQLNAFYQIFPSEHEATGWVGKIAAIARRDGLELQQADYKVSRDKIGRLTRLQMNLPLSGEYPKIRGFLSDLRTEIPIVSLEQVDFARPKIGDQKVDAKIRLVIFLESA